MVSTPSDSDEHESGDDADPIVLRSGHAPQDDEQGSIVLRGGDDGRADTSYGYARFNGEGWVFLQDTLGTSPTWTITSTNAGQNYTISTNDITISTSTPSQPTVSPGFDMSVYTPSMTHFQEWMDRLTADEEIHFHYQGGNTSPPYFNHGSYRDYEYVMEVSGRTIMGYADGRPRVPEGGTEIRFPLSGQDADTVLIGYTVVNGIFLSMDPRYLRFVTKNEETGLWDHVEVEEGEPNACHVFLEAIGAEAFYRRWRPPTLEDIMQRTWLQKRERQISTANRRVSEHAAAITDIEARLERSRRAIVTARATLCEWGHMTLEKFIETINVYRDQLEGIGSNLEVTEGSVSIILASFEIQGVTLGPYKITFDLAESRIKVGPHGNSNPSRNGHIHPHITGDTVCWESTMTFTTPRSAIHSRRCSSPQAFSRQGTRHRAHIVGWKAGLRTTPTSASSAEPDTPTAPDAPPNVGSATRR